MNAWTEVASCVDCGARIERAPSESWRRRCLPCWLRFRRPVPVDREAGRIWIARARAAIGGAR